MPWTELEINGEKTRVHFSPGKDYLSGKATLEDVHNEIRKAMEQVARGEATFGLPGDLDADLEEKSID